MSSSDDNTTAKKRKAIANDDVVEGLESSASAAAMMAQMKAHMTRMQNEMDGMRGRLSEVDNMKSEMNDMKGRLSRMDELEGKCKSLEVKCNSLERSVQILMKESKWEYSAPSIPTSHWVDLDFDENYIQGMECLLEQLEDSTIALRSGECYDILLSGDSEDDETILLHDDILLPHWKEFANALQLNQNSSRLLSICTVQLTSSVMDLLVPALKGKPFKIINFNNNELVNVREGIEFAVKSMENSSELERFNWVNNRIDTMENAQFLLDSMTTHPHVDKVRLECCFGEDINGYEILRVLLASGKRFLSLDLEKNNIRTGGTEISDYLATNPPLENLYLGGNHLDDNDAILIASALKQNTNLQRLRLGDNEFTEKGKNALSNAIYDSSSLNSVADCNHRCSIEGIYLGVYIPDITNHDITPKVNMARKIYHLLSLRNVEGSNVQHLNAEFDDDDDSLALVPNVLASVHQYYHGSMFERHSDSDQVRPLSIMYEILRSWKMPQLYECRGMTTKK